MVLIKKFLVDSEIHLFTTFFVSTSEDRQKELNYCLETNLKNKLIKSVNVFVENTTDLNGLKFLEEPDLYQHYKKLKIIFLGHIPTYKDWLIQPVEGISVFCNADIYFDESLSGLKKYTELKNSIVCLTRCEVKDSIMPHSNPHWSQDCWAIKGSNLADVSFVEKLNVSTGKMRCDNKLAYIFCMHGWSLFNPVNEISCYHLHGSKLRDYKALDTSVIGALGFVYPCKSPEHPSEVEINIMPLSTSNIRTKVEINGYLDKLS